MTPTPVTVDLFSDIVCPWCYIGEARLKKALEQLPNLQVSVRWQPFQLQPQLPPQGLPWRAFAESKFGSLTQAEAAFAHVTQAGVEDGLEFRFDRVASAPNTVDAHRLVLFAQERGQDMAAADGLFRAYFSEGANLNDLETLLKLMQALGFEREEVAGLLEGDTFREEVITSQQQAAHYGIQGVPFFVLNGRYGLSGAQPVEVMVGALEQAAASTPTPA